MKYFFLIFVFITCFGKVSAQETDWNSQSLEFHINPFTPLATTPRWRVGFEYDTKKQLAISLDVGIGNYFMNRDRLNSLIWDKHYTFYEIRPEVKYYISHPGKDYAFYTALEGFYLQMSDVLRDSYYYPNTNEERMHYDLAELKKTKTGGHIKLGLKTVLWNRLTFDFYAGIGAAYRDFNYTNIINPALNDGIYFSEWFIFQSNQFRHEGSSTTIHLTGGIKLGYLIQGN